MDSLPGLREHIVTYPRPQRRMLTAGELVAKTPMCFSKSVAQGRSDCSAGTAGSANLTSQGGAEGRLSRRKQRIQRKQRRRREAEAAEAHVLHRRQARGARAKQQFLGKPQRGDGEVISMKRKVHNGM
jgi:hypothetical protein